MKIRIRKMRCLSIRRPHQKNYLDADITSWHITIFDVFYNNYASRVRWSTTILRLMESTVLKVYRHYSWAWPQTTQREDVRAQKLLQAPHRPYRKDTKQILTGNNLRWKIRLYHTWVWNRGICMCVIVRPRSHMLIVLKKVIPDTTRYDFA